MARHRQTLDRRLEQAARHLRLVSDALGRLSPKDVWFVVSPSALQYYNPPIAPDACIEGTRGQAARISVEGLSLVVQESLSTLAQARKALRRRPSPGGTATKRARR